MGEDDMALIREWKDNHLFTCGTTSQCRGFMKRSMTIAETNLAERIKLLSELKMDVCSDQTMRRPCSEKTMMNRICGFGTEILPSGISGSTGLDGKNLRQSAPPRLGTPQFRRFSGDISTAPGAVPNR